MDIKKLFLLLFMRVLECVTRQRGDFSNSVG